MSRHSLHSRLRAKMFAQPRFLLDAGKLEAGL
jgi:hypothetical protein